MIEPCIIGIPPVQVNRKFSHFGGPMRPPEAAEAEYFAISGATGHPGEVCKRPDSQIGYYETPERKAIRRTGCFKSSGVYALYNGRWGRRLFPPRAGVGRQCGQRKRDESPGRADFRGGRRTGGAG